MRLFTRMLMLALALWSAWAPCAFARPVMVLRSGAPSDVTAPTYQSSSIASNGSTLTIVFSEAVVAANANGFTLTPSGGSATLTLSSGSGTSSLVFTASRTIYDDETATIAYSSTTGDVQDESGNDLATFSATSVTNNSTQGGGGPPPPEDEIILAAAATQQIADEGSINFTPTVIQGTGLKYAVSSPPAGASFNTSTGALTGTLSTPGLWKTRITAYIDADADNTFDASEVNDHITVGVIVYAATETINDAWITSHGPFPITLTNCEHTRFVFAVNVDAPGSAFRIADNNVYLVDDGNHRELHYGGANGSRNCSDVLSAREHAVALYTNSGDSEWPVISGGAAAFNCAVVGLHIINDGSDTKAHGIFGRRSQGFLVADATIETDGDDSHTVFMRYAEDGTAYVLNNALTTDADGSCNRHAGPANIGSTDAITYVVERNACIGGNSAVTCHTDSEVYKNFLSHNGHVTNGYGVFIYRCDNVSVRRNLILPVNGRGVLFNAGTGHVVSDNVLLHLEAPNAEFGEALNPPAVRGRYETDDITYADNYSLGIGGTDLTSASTFYISSNGSGSCTYTNNTGDTILIGNPDMSHYVNGVTLEGTGTDTVEAIGPGLDVVSGNTLRSNYCQVRLEGYDGYTNQLTPLADNSFDWVTGATAYADFMEAANERFATLGLLPHVEAVAEARLAEVDELVEGLIGDVPLHASRVAFHAKYYGHSGTTTTLDVLDSDWNGVDSDSWTIADSALSFGSLNAREGFKQAVLIKSPGGSPLANQTVTVTSNQGDVTTATTNGSGVATITFFRFAIIKSNAVGAPISVVNRTSSTVSYGGNSAVITHSSVPAEVVLQ